MPVRNNSHFQVILGGQTYSAHMGPNSQLIVEVCIGTQMHQGTINEDGHLVIDLGDFPESPAAAPVNSTDSTDYLFNDTSSSDSDARAPQPNNIDSSSSDFSDLSDSSDSSDLEDCSSPPRAPRVARRAIPRRARSHNIDSSSSVSSDSEDWLSAPRTPRAPRVARRAIPRRARSPSPQPRVPRNHSPQPRVPRTHSPQPRVPRDRSRSRDRPQPAGLFGSSSIFGSSSRVVAPRRANAFIGSGNGGGGGSGQSTSARVVRIQPANSRPSCSVCLEPVHGTYYVCGQTLRHPNPHVTCLLCQSRWEEASPDPSCPMCRDPNMHQCTH